MKWFEAATPWTSGLPGARLARLLFATTAVAMVTGTLCVRPLRDGDAGEYLLMTESLVRHGTPELRPADVQSLARLDQRAHLNLDYASGFLGYYNDDRGRWYSYHFWSYPLLALPARLVLAVPPANGLHALPLTNALLFLLALHRVLFLAPFHHEGRFSLFLLMLVSPLLWFIRWPHPEVMTASCVLLSLVGSYRGLRRAPVFWAALASLQAPPLIFLTGLFWGWGCLAERRLVNFIAVSLAGLPALAAPLFFFWHFGTISLIARESTSLSNLSFSRAIELFLDLNLGLLPYMPVAMLLFGVAAIAAVRRAWRERLDATLLVTLLLMALGCTVTSNWNHGTVGPSRYAVWLSPILLLLIARLGENLSGAVRWAFRGLLGLAVAAQAVIIIATGGLVARADYLDHSYAARLVLRHAPALYNPSFPVFVARTTHTVLEMAGPGPFIYIDDSGCRKALVRPEPRHKWELSRACGFVPAAYDGWFNAASDTEWRYINY